MVIPGVGGSSPLRRMICGHGSVTGFQTGMNNDVTAKRRRSITVPGRPAISPGGNSGYSCNTRFRDHIMVGGMLRLVCRKLQLAAVGR